MQVRYGEGAVSTPTRVMRGGREAASEASIGECVGAVLSGARQVWGAYVFRATEGDKVREDDREIQAARPVDASQTLSKRRSIPPGNRETAIAVPDRVVVGDAFWWSELMRC